MDDFEKQLRDTLGRKEPPAWFEAKVLARATARGPRFGLLRWVVATGSAFAIAAGLWTDHQTAMRERVQGEAAKARLELALKITAAQLAKIQKTMRASTEEE